MPCKSEKRTINGHEYTVTQMPPSKAVPYHVELATLVAEVLGPMANTEANGQDAVVEALSMAGPALRANLSPARFLEIARDWTGSGLVHRDGELVNFEQHFAGSDMPDLYRVMVFIAEVNFSDFFVGLDLSGLASAAMARASMSPASVPTSTGNSGG